MMARSPGAAGRSTVLSPKMIGGSHRAHPQSRPGVGHDHAHHRSPRTPGRLRSRDWAASGCQSKWCEWRRRASRWIGQASNRASAPPGRSWAATRPCCAPVTPSSTTPPGARVPRVYGRTRPSWASPTASAPPGCAFATSYCATVLGQTPSALSLSSGFQAIPTPPTAANFTGSFVYTSPRISSMAWCSNTT